MNEQIQIWGFIVNAVTLFVGIGIAFYKFNEHIKEDIDGKIGRVYKRMDEKATIIEKTFVRQDIHDIELKNLNDKSDARADSMMRHIDLRMDTVMNGIKDLSDRINKNQ